RKAPMPMTAKSRTSVLLSTAAPASSAVETPSATASTAPISAPAGRSTGSHRSLRPATSAYVTPNTKSPFHIERPPAPRYAGSARPVSVRGLGWRRAPYGGRALERPLRARAGERGARGHRDVLAVRRCRRLRGRRDAPLGRRAALAAE